MSAFTFVWAVSLLVILWIFFFLMIRRPPGSTRTDTLFPTRRSADLGRNASIAPISAGATPISTPPTMPLVCGIGSAIEDDHGGSDKTAGIAGRRLDRRSEEHTSELQSLMRISYAVFCLQKKKLHK